jgi:hypothetical protein
MSLQTSLSCDWQNYIHCHKFRKIRVKQITFPTNILYNELSQFPNPSKGGLIVLTSHIPDFTLNIYTSFTSPSMCELIMPALQVTS